MSNKTSPPSYLNGFLWLTFSGTAMVSAFIFPVHIWALAASYKMNFSSLPFRIYFAFLFICALYHSLYRVKTILKDLKII